MSPFAESNLACAQKNVDRAITLVEDYAASEFPDPRLIPALFAELLDLKTRIGAAVRIEGMQEEMGTADTERPRRLRLVTE